MRIFLYIMIKYLAALLVFGIATEGISQTVLFQEDFTTGIPATWILYNQDGLTPDTSVAEFDAAWIAKIIGTDTCAASTSFYNPAGQASDYLVTPLLSIGNFSKLVWSARSVDASYPDGYYVLISDTDNAVESFTDTLVYVAAENNFFEARSIDLDIEGYANQDVYIAFKNVTNDGYILLLDEVVLLGAETAHVNNNPSITGLDIQLYPNPAQDFIQLNTTEHVQKITVYNTTGQPLLTTTNSQFSVERLASGTYFISILTDNGLMTKSFVKK